MADDDRLTELEIRQTHLEDTIDVLNKTVIEQNDRIKRLELQVELLERKLASARQSNIAHESEETPPPHY